MAKLKLKHKIVALLRKKKNKKKEFSAEQIANRIGEDVDIVIRMLIEMSRNEEIRFFFHKNGKRMYYL